MCVYPHHVTANNDGICLTDSDSVTVAQKRDRAAKLVRLTKDNSQLNRMPKLSDSCTQIIKLGALIIKQSRNY